MAPGVSPPKAAALSTGALAIRDSVIARADAARILEAFRAGSLTTTPSDVSRVNLLSGSLGFAWRVGQESLHIHTYVDPKSASDGGQRFIVAAMARSQITDWAGKPHLYRCGSALALYLGENAKALSTLSKSCGMPLWAR